MAVVWQQASDIGASALAKCVFWCSADGQMPARDHENAVSIAMLRELVSVYIRAYYVLPYMHFICSVRIYG